MIKIKFNDEEVFRDVEFTRKDHIITLKGITLKNESGFTTWRMDAKTQLGDFSDFTTVYRVMENAVQYSNDGRVWPDNAPDIPPVPVHDPMERIAALEAAMTAIEEGIASV